MDRTPYIVGIGGTLRRGSSSEIAMRWVLRHAESLGAECKAFAGADLQMPAYAPDHGIRSQAANALVEALRRADGVVISSPAYHGCVSGLFKNAIDYTEDLRGDDRIYLARRAVGCIASAGGPQAGVATLASLRSIVHALRGWPTPLGVFVENSSPVFDVNGNCLDAELHDQLRIMAEEIVGFARSQLASSGKAEAAALAAG